MKLEEFVDRVFDRFFSELARYGVKWRTVEGPVDLSSEHLYVSIVWEETTIDPLADDALALPLAGRVIDALSEGAHIAGIDTYTGEETVDFYVLPDTRYSRVFRSSCRGMRAVLELSAELKKEVLSLDICFKVRSKDGQDK